MEAMKEEVTEEEMTELKKLLEMVKQTSQKQQERIEAAKGKERTPFDDLDWEPKKAILAIRSLAYLFEQIDENIDCAAYSEYIGWCGLLEAVADKVEKVLIGSA